ncbi:MAG: arsenate reductase (glutaredoxin) [Legionellaceae bacterium]|nr:arsenate reductase (glutaredoxin) [Legionellaceae bacterium]
MDTYTIYHNPRCSKSREALEILRQQHIEPIIIEYLKTPLSMQLLKELLVQFSIKDFVRYKDQTFKDLNLSLDDEDAVLSAMVEEPILMQRPIVACGTKAIIARPPEKVLELI